jgi:chromosome segregation ATPase
MPFCVDWSDRHHSDVASLQHALQQARAELSERKAKLSEVKRHAKAKLDEVARTFAAKLNASEAELRATQEKARLAERAKATASRELEANLSQTIALYSAIQQHQSTIEQQRVKCEQSDAQYAAVSAKLKGAEKEMQRLRLMLDKEHDSNERHISALKGQLALKTDECLALQSRLKTLEEEYAAHKAELEARISALEKDRSLLEAVNFELRAERERNHQLAKENEEMKETVLAKAHLEGQHAAALAQMEVQSQTISRLENERAQWVGERRDLDHQLGDQLAQIKQLTIERDALQIELSAKEKQRVEESNEYQRKETVLQNQLADRDALLTRSQATIDALTSEGTGLRAERKEHLDTVESLEASIRDLHREAEERLDALQATQTQLADVSAQLEAAEQKVASSATELAEEQKKLKRTRTSRRALVEKLDQGYNGSYLAQIFMKWKHEWRVQDKERALHTVQESRAALHSEHEAQQEALQAAQREKERQQESTAEAIRAMENALQAEREEARAHVERAQKAWEESQTRKLQQSRAEWEREQALKREEEREEELARKLRIAQEREKVRAEMEEARRLELDALKAREASSSMSVASRNHNTSAHIASAH